MKSRLNVPIKMVVARVSVDVIRLSFVVTTKAKQEIHHWDFSNTRALDLARAILDELERPLA
jgi:hypothetical protein